MKEILEAKLEDLEWLSKNAGNWEYYLGQYDLCKLLLSEINDMVHSFHQDDDYDNYYANEYGRDYYDVDEWIIHNDEQNWYKEQEIDDMYNKHYHYSWWIGKDVMNIDNLWFTSDEIEAFREIWQRRVSA